jgi:hypothetical protein
MVALIYRCLQLNSFNLIIISICFSHVSAKVRSWSVMTSLLWIARTKDLKNTALANPLSIRRLTDVWIERSGGTIIKRAKPKCWEKNQPRCPFVHHKFYVHCPGTETGLHGENPPARQAHKLQHNLAQTKSAHSPFSAQTTIKKNGQNFASVRICLGRCTVTVKAVFYGSLRSGCRVYHPEILKRQILFHLLK